ncbi:MAG: ECF transporter S component [bacterium]|nr:ECF transporter S component [bacterium]
MYLLTQTKPLPKILNLSEIKYYAFSLAFTAAAVSLPWLLHQFKLAGPEFLPMHFFILTAGFLFGWKTGIMVGVLSPLMSYGLTHLPPLAILSEVMVELAVYGLAIGLLREKKLNIWFSLLGAMVAGRLARLAFVLALGFSTNPMGYFLMSWKGIVLQITLIPILIFFIQRFLSKNDERTV